MSNTNSQEYWENIISLNRDKCEKQMREYENLSNAIFIDVTKILITLNTGLLVFTSPIVGTKILDGKTNLIILISEVWILLGASILAGLIQLLVDNRYYENVSKLYERLTIIFNNSETTKEGFHSALRKSEIESRRDFRSSSSLIAFVLQATFFLIALVLLICSFISVI